MPRCPRPVRRCLVAVCLLGGTVACRDSPTVPHALQQLAGGEGWLAVSVPEGLPALATWLPYLDRASPEGAVVGVRVRALEQSAVRARRAGQLQLASDLDREAVRLAVGALHRAPEPAVLRRGLAAAELWTQRIRSQPQLETAPELIASLVAVDSARAGAVRALTSGDTTTAVLLLAQAAERIRWHAPEAVALRVLTRVESQLRSDGAATTPAGERALYLVRSAREELVVGSPTRALRRALYALQLAEGRELRAVPPVPHPCAPAGCEGL